MSDRRAVTTLGSSGSGPLELWLISPPCHPCCHSVPGARTRALHKGHIPLRAGSARARLTLRISIAWAYGQAAGVAVPVPSVRFRSVGSRCTPESVSAPRGAPRRPEQSSTWSLSSCLALAVFLRDNFKRALGGVLWGWYLGFFNHTINS